MWCTCIQFRYIYIEIHMYIWPIINVLCTTTIHICTKPAYITKVTLFTAIIIQQIEKINLIQINMRTLTMEIYSRKSWSSSLDPNPEHSIMEIAIILVHLRYANFRNLVTFRTMRRKCKEYLYNLS